MNWIGRLGLALAVVGLLLIALQVLLLLPRFIRLTTRVKVMTLL